MTINTNLKLCKQRPLAAAFGCTGESLQIPLNPFTQNSLCNWMQLVLDQLHNKMQKQIFLFLSGLANISILDDHNQYLNLLKNLTYIIGSYTIKSLSPWTVETFMTYILHYAFLVALCGVPWRSISMSDGGKESNEI